MARLLLLLLFPPLGAAEPEEAEGGRALSCLAAAPSMAWYLDAAADTSNSSSTLVGMERRRLQRRLDCSAVHPAGGRPAGASVTLHVQFEPELVQLEGRSGEAGQPGLLLVLLVVVQASPPASITWLRPDGRLLVNTTHFLLVDAHAYPWLANRSLDVQLRAWSHNCSRDHDGLLNASLLLPGFLDTHIELPLLALVIGAAVALGLLAGLGALITYLGYQKGKKAAGLPLPAQLPPSGPNHLNPQGPRLPRANRSLPSNLQLNDLTLPPQGAGAQVTAEGVEEEERALSEPENSLALADRGLSHFPMVGYIYRASSGSSEEIWL